MNHAQPNVAQQIAKLACRSHERRTAHAPTAVSVVLSDDTLVVTMHEALTPAERALASTPRGAAQMQEYHRQLFADSAPEMRQEIQRITGRRVCEAAAKIEIDTGAVMHAFTTGAMVQMFLLIPDGQAPTVTGSYPMKLHVGELPENPWPAPQNLIQVL